MTEPKFFTDARITAIIYWSVAIVLSLIVVACFWATIWYQPTWDRLNDGLPFQIPPWGKWESRDRLLLHYGIPLWLSALVSAYFATFPWVRFRPEQAPNQTRLELFVILGAIALMLVVVPVGLVVLMVLAGSTWIFHGLRRQQALSRYDIFSSPWIWTFSCLPLVGMLGMFAPVLIVLLVASTLLFVSRFMQGEIDRIHGLVLPINGMWLILLFQFASDWFTIYGD
jgi:hypothetical protein